MGKSKTCIHGITPKYKCQKCNAEYNNKRQKEWRKKNPDRRAKIRKRFHEKHRKQELEYCKDYYLKHKTERREHVKRYEKTHKEQRKKLNSSYFKRNKEQLYRNRKRRYNDLKYKTRKCALKVRAKRRNLGFVPLNQPFKDSEAHHIDKIHIIYIPQELHNSIKHNVWTGYNMEKINAKVFEWMIAESKPL